MPVQEADHNYESLNQHLHPFYQPDPSLSSQNDFHHETPLHYQQHPYRSPHDDDNHNNNNNNNNNHPPSGSAAAPLPLLPATTYSPPRAAARQQPLSLTTNLLDQRRSHNSNFRDDHSPDPREFYLQYRDPFGSDGAGPDDVDMTTASYSRRSSGPSNGSPAPSQRYRASSRAQQLRSSSGHRPANDLSPPKQRRTPLSPSATRNRQSSLKELVDRFNQTRDEVPPRPPARTSSRGGSPTRVPRSYGRSSTSSSTNPSSVHQPSSQRDSRPSFRHSKTSPPGSHKTRTPQNTVRKPLFGEILPLDTFAAHQERRRTSHQRRGSDSCMHSPGPMFLDLPLDVNAGWSPTSPTAWYLGYTPSLDTTNTLTTPPLLHRRSRSDLAGNCSQPMTPASFNPSKGVKSPTSPTSSSSARQRSASSRIPVSTRRPSQTSDSGNSSPSTRTNSAMDRHPMNTSLPPKGSSALPKPSPKLHPSPKFRSPIHSPRSPRITSPCRRNGSRAAQNLQPLKSPTLKAIITAPPPKKSPPLRSSRPRQPVSTATTSASRAKVVDRISDFQNNAMTPKSPRAARAKSRRLPELGNVDFAARRQRIQQAFNKTIEESNKKEIAKKAQREARLKDAAEGKGGHEEGNSNDPLRQAEDNGTVIVVAEEEEEERTHTADSSDTIEDDQETFVTPQEGRSPDMPLPPKHELANPLTNENINNITVEEPNTTTITSSLDIPDTDIHTHTQSSAAAADGVRPLSACSDTTPESAVTAATDTTTFDIEPQIDFPRPLDFESHRTMLSHIMQMRESSPDITDDSDLEDDDDESSSGRDKEEIQIMLRQTYFEPIDDPDSHADADVDADVNGGRGGGSSSQVEAADRQRWSMSSWSSSIQNVQNHQQKQQQLGDAETGLSDEEQEEEDGTGTLESTTCASERAVTPQPQMQMQLERTTPASAAAVRPSGTEGDTSTHPTTTKQEPDMAKDAAAATPPPAATTAADVGLKQSPRPVERFSLNLMHRYPDLAKQAKWDTKRATQLYLQELAKAGFGQPRIPDPPQKKKTEEEKKKNKGLSVPLNDEKTATSTSTTLQDDGIAEDAVMLPESKSIPPSDYVPQLASLTEREDWERASPSIADWMHRAATGREESIVVPERDDALTPRISTMGLSYVGSAADSSAMGMHGNGLGVSIHVHSPQDGDSPTIPELPNYPPPPPPSVPLPPPAAGASIPRDRSVDSLHRHQQQPSQASPSVYSQNPPPSDILPSTTFVPQQRDYDTRPKNSHESLLSQTDTNSLSRLASSSPTSLDQQSIQQRNIDVPSPKKTPTPEQRRLRKRLLVIKELIDTEYTFGQDMTVVVDIYKGTSSSCGLTPEDVKSLFGNAEQVVKFSMDFQDALKQAAKSVYVLPKSQRWLSKRSSRFTTASGSSSTCAESLEISDDEKDRKTTIGQSFMELIGRMEKVYSEYLKNHDSANKTLDTLLKNKNKHVSVWLKECRDWASDLTTAWSLDSLLVKPVQRMLKYPLLLTELLSTTPTDHPDHAAIANALRETTAMSVRINDMKKRADVVGQVISSRKRKESDVRAGLSKAFGRRTEKLKQHVGLSEMLMDKDYDLLSQQFSENFFNVQLIMRDVELYTTEMRNSVNRFNEFTLAIEAYMTLAPTNYPELESKWCRFRLAVKDIMTVALVDHLASVRKSVINPMVTLVKLHDGPQRVMQKRNKRLLDYVKYKAIKERGDKPDKKTAELGEQFIALNVTLKEELPRLFALTGKLMGACLNNFVQIQTIWNTMIQKRLGYTIDRMPQDVSQIISDWSGDFTFSEAQVLSLGVCNGTVLAETAIVHNFSAPSTSHGVDSASSRRASSTTTRTFSVEYGQSPKVSVEFGANPSVSFMQSSSHGEAGGGFMHHTNGSHGHLGGGRSRTNSNFSGTHISSMNTVMNSSTRGSTTPSTIATSNTSFRTTDASPLLPQLSLDTPRFPEFFSDALTPGGFSNTSANLRPGAPDLAEHPSSPDAPRYSGFFSSAMPMNEAATPILPSSDPPPDSQSHSHLTNAPTASSASVSSSTLTSSIQAPKVLFLAASMFEFNIDRARREAGYPYLTYVAGEIFDVIGEKGDLWLARNQDDPTGQVGWIWTKHFAKLAG